MLYWMCCCWCLFDGVVLCGCVLQSVYVYAVYIMLVYGVEYTVLYCMLMCWFESCIVACIAMYGRSKLKGMRLYCIM